MMNFHFWVNYFFKTTEHFIVLHKSVCLNHPFFLVSLGPDKAFKSFPALLFWFDCIITPPVAENHMPNTITHPGKYRAGTLSLSFLLQFVGDAKPKPSSQSCDSVMVGEGKN